MNLCITLFCYKEGQAVSCALAYYGDTIFVSLGILIISGILGQLLDDLLTLAACFPSLETLCIRLAWRRFQDLVYRSSPQEDEIETAAKQCRNLQCLLFQVRVELLSPYVWSDIYKELSWLHELPTIRRIGRLELISTSIELDTPCCRHLCRGYNAEQITYVLDGLKLPG